MKKLLLLMVFLSVGFSAVGQFSLTGIGSGNTYTQNFDVFRGTALTLPANWAANTATFNTTFPILTSGAASPTVANASGNNCYAGRASSLSSDYSILQKQATTGSTTFTFNVVNNTGANITGFVIGWNVEQFNDAGRATTVDFTYRSAATAFGTIGISGTNLYTSTTGSSTTFNVVQTARAITITGLTIPNGTTVDFRFNITTGINSGSNAHVGIDDFTVYANGGAPATPVLAVTGTPANLGSVCPNTAAATVQYTITNTGTAATGVVVSSNDSQFVVSNLSSSSIAATNGTATYDVTFTPTSSGAKSATISVFYNTNTLSTTSALTGTGSSTVAQTVTSSAATSLTDTTATLNGNVTTLGTCPNSTQKGFVFSSGSVNNNPIVGGSGVTLTQVAGIATGVYTLPLAALLPGTQYFFNSYVFNGTAYTYGAVRDFTTTNSFASDIIGVANSESATISSIINTAVINSITDGSQVWQFTIRDGGGSTDADMLPTIVNNIIITQSSGNEMNNWSDAIQSVALFNGATKIADGVVTANQISFTGVPLVSVPDNSAVILSLRLSVQTSPDDVAPGSNVDGEDFGFQIASANVIFANTGSGKSAFAAANSLNSQNIFSVVATKLLFVVQPSNTSQTFNMSPFPAVRATDVNNNTDRNFVSTVSITSSGTLSPATANSNGILGVATFISIIHTALGTGFQLTATAAGLGAVLSTTFNINASTVFAPGDLLFVGFDAQVLGTGNGDEYLITTMVDIVPGSRFSIVNSRYEAGAAANVRTNKWGGGSDDASDSPAVMVISYNGLTNIPAGALLQIRNDVGGITSIATIIGTTVSANLFPSQFSASDNGLLVNLSVTAVAGDQLYLIQGSFTSDGSINAGQANYILNGTVLHGLSTQAAWVPLTNACSGGSTATSRVSRLHPTLSCYNIFVTGSEPSGYFENDKLHSGSKRDILNAISDLTNNCDVLFYKAHLEVSF